MDDLIVVDNLEYSIPTIILNVVLIMIVGFLSILFCKSKSFHTYPCYYIIILNLSFFIDNLFRILPLDKSTDGSNNYSLGEYFQAFILVFFDHFMITIITSQTIIYYLGYIKTESYFKYEKVIFFLTLSISLIICLLLSSLDIYFGEGGHIKHNKIYCYSTKSDFKKISDITLNIICLIINIFCLLNLFVYVSNKKKEAKAGLIEDLDYSHHYIKILAMLIINPLFFLVSFLIIYNQINGFTADIIYLVACIVINFLYSLNRIIFKETLKIFCKDTYKERYEKLKGLKVFKNQTSNEEEDDDEDDDKRSQRTESF